MARRLMDYPSWVKRMEKYFAFIDRNKDGVITIYEIQQWASSMEILCKVRPVDMVRLRAELYRFWSKIGLIPDVKMTKMEFIKGASKLGEEESLRIKKADVTSLQRVSSAYFDVFDIDNDGVVTLEDLRTVMVATNNNPDDAETWLDIMGSGKKNGTVDRNDVFHNEFNFWFNPCGKCILCANVPECYENPWPSEIDFSEDSPAVLRII